MRVVVGVVAERTAVPMGLVVLVVVAMAAIRVRMEPTVSAVAAAVVSLTRIKDPAATAVTAS